MKTLCIIPARGGSKGVPGKNIKQLNGIPLLAYSITCAKECFSVEDICVSTDDSEIANVAEENGLKVPFMRPEQLSSDTSTTRDLILHAVEYYKEHEVNYDAVALLQPTSPFRKPEHVQKSIALFNLDLDMVVTVKRAKSNPYFTLFEENNNGYLEQSKKGNYTRRQDSPDVWEYNGACYIINVAALKKMEISQFKKIVKSEMNALDSLDIDTPLDWKIAEIVAKGALLDL